MKEFEYLAPESMQQALEWLNTHRGRARILAGGTDLYLRLRKGVFLPDYVIDLKWVPRLDYIDTQSRRWSPDWTDHIAR